MWRPAHWAHYDPDSTGRIARYAHRFPYHTVVETQLAEKHAPVKTACLRFRKGGLNRHEAIHAIGSVSAEHVWGVVNEDMLEPDPNEAYFAALDELTVESWHEAYRDQD
jgi:hypothetical protein